MHRYILRRLLYGIYVLLGVITLVFALFNILPGDPARMMLGQRADIASVEAINRELGLDQPLLVQYAGFLNDLSPVSFHSVADPASMWYPDPGKYAPFTALLSTGDARIILKKPYLRRSYQSQRKVSEIIAQAFPNTMLLAAVAIGFAAILGIFTGVMAALHKDSLFDRLSMVLSVFGMSLPSFFAAILMAWLFAYVLAQYTGLNMFGSLWSVDDLGRGEYLDLKNLILPALTLGIRPLAIIIELTRSSVLEVLSQDFVRTAKAKGLSKFRVIARHVMRNAMNPVVTAVSGWFASLMAGAVFVEYVFDWKGIGVVIVGALEKYDFPVAMGAVLFIAVMLVIINIFVDIIYGLLDPRVRLAG
ncbi:MAG TPA: ABC transporter permease [Lentimicrobium sp.]|jgi:peptide/nickel transport system permease protein|nr:ABC transporter permease [Lentimicrobium sp.]